MSDSSRRTQAYEVSGHLRELDGIRGIAILAVLASHAVDLVGIVPTAYTASAWPSVVRRLFIPGWGGVDLFFTLSGYLITGILLRSLENPGYFRHFYGRRAVRIFPIYYIFLVGSLLIVFLHPAASYLVPRHPAEIASFFFYIQNWPIFWKSWAGMTTTWGIFWSLAVEEQFYLLWPSLVRICSSGVMLALCAIGFSAGTLERWIMIRHFGLQFGVMQWPFSRLDGLFLGSALAFYRQRYRHALPLRYAASLFGIGAVLWALLTWQHSDQFSGAGKELWVFGVTAFSLMSCGLVALSHYRIPWLHRLLTIRPLLAAGKFSYGIYVYHLVIFIKAGELWRNSIAPQLGMEPHPALIGLFLLSVCIVAVIVAAFSFRYIEAPFLRLKRFFPSPSALV